MEFDAPGELGWQALKYAARRLPETELESFEEQLYSDQSAREAVAQAVELSHTVAVLHSQVSDEEAPGPLPSDMDARPAQVASISPQRSWSKSLAWLALGVAASLAFAFTHPQWFAADVHPETAQPNELVAASWADLNTAENESGRTMLTSFVVDPHAADEESALPEVGTETEIVPDWMRLGVENRNDASPKSDSLKNVN